MKTLILLLTFSACIYQATSMSGCMKEGSKKMMKKLMESMCDAELPGCFNPLKVSTTVSDVTVKCCAETKDMVNKLKKDSMKNRIKSMFSGSPRDAMKEVVEDIFENYMNCTVDNFADLVDSNGNINYATVQTEIDSFTGDDDLKTALKSVVTDCENNADTTLSTSDQMEAFFECKIRGMYQSCVNRDNSTEGLGEAIIMMAVADEDNSTCVDVDVMTTVQPILLKCMQANDVDPCVMRNRARSFREAMESGDVKGMTDKIKSFVEKMRGSGSGTGRRGRRQAGRGRGRGKKGGGKRRGRRNGKCKAMMGKMMEKGMAIHKCVAEDLEIIVDDTLNFDTAKAVIAGFDGYSSLSQETQDAITAGIDYCSAKATDPDAAISDEMIKKMPMLKNADDLMKTAFLFSKCFMPNFANTCGIKNELGMFLFPLSHMLISKQEKQELFGENPFNCTDTDVSTAAMESYAETHYLSDDSGSVEDYSDEDYSSEEYADDYFDDYYGDSDYPF